MPQPVLNLLEGYAVGQQEGGAAMPEIVEAHFLHAVPLDEGGKLRGQVIGLHPLAQLIYEYKAVVFIVVAVAADLLVQLLRRLDLCKIFLESSHQRQGAHTGFGFCRLQYLRAIFSKSPDFMRVCGRTRLTETDRRNHVSNRR